MNISGHIGPVPSGRFTMFSALRQFPAVGYKAWSGEDFVASWFATRVAGHQVGFKGNVPVFQAAAFDQVFQHVESAPGNFIDRH